MMVKMSALTGSTCMVATGAVLTRDDDSTGSNWLESNDSVGSSTSGVQMADMSGMLKINNCNFVLRSLLAFTNNNE